MLLLIIDVDLRARAVEGMLRDLTQSGQDLINNIETLL